jgi:hypothetical protein
MKRVFDEDVFPRIEQLLDCWLGVSGLFPEKTEGEWAIEALRMLHNTPNTSEQLKQKIIDKLSAKGATLQPSDDEEHYETCLFRTIKECFAAPSGLIKADSGEERRKYKTAIETAQRTLDALHQQAPSELKDITASALKEFAAATLIARSDILMTREEAHNRLQNPPERHP